MSKIKFKTFRITDYEKELAWLEEQNKNGLKLKKKIASSLFIFEKEEPKEYVYQLDYNSDEVTDDYIKLYGDYGFEYCCSYGGTHYFRKEKSKVNDDIDYEIFSDNESKQAMMLEKLDERKLSSINYKNKKLTFFDLFNLLIAFAAPLLYVFLAIANSDFMSFQSVTVIFAVAALAAVGLRNYCKLCENKIEFKNKNYTLILVKILIFIGFIAYWNVIYYMFLKNKMAIYFDYFQAGLGIWSIIFAVMAILFLNFAIKKNVKWFNLYIASLILGACINYIKCICTDSLLNIEISDRLINLFIF